MKANRIVLMAGMGILLAALPVAAHHGLSTQFDTSQTITLEGTVEKIAWINPHVRFYIDVKDASNVVANWEIDMGSANDQMLRGWKIDSFRPGDRITVEAYRAKDGSNLGFARKITRSTR